MSEESIDVKEVEKAVDQIAVAQQAPESIALTPEDIKKQEMLEYTQFLANPENQKNALNMAMQMQSVIGERWFNLGRAQVKFKLGRAEAYQKISICKEFGFIETKIGQYSDGKNVRDEQLFRVIVTKEQKMNSLQEAITWHTEKIQALQSQIQALVGRSEG
jgi:hypothetical protein